METRKAAGGVRRRYECGNMHRFTTKDHIVVRTDDTKLLRGRPTKEEANDPSKYVPL